jgi:hypothetical protein
MPEICSFSTILENYFLWAAAMSGATTTTQVYDILKGYTKQDEADKD